MDFQQVVNCARPKALFENLFDIVLFMIDAFSPRSSLLAHNTRLNCVAVDFYKCWRRKDRFYSVMFAM